jgi:hypothetical protein
MSMRISLITIFFLCTIVSGFFSAVVEGDEFDELTKINASNGINKQEAYIIAKAFFLSEISGCGFPDEPVKQSGYWVSGTRIGLDGSYGEFIYIDINTGTITWKNESSVVKMTLKELIKRSQK